MRLIVDIPKKRYEALLARSKVIYLSGDELAIATGIPYKSPKHGEWLRKSDGLPHLVTIKWFICSECGAQKSVATPFCPHCGAKMKGVDE